MNKPDELAEPPLECGVRPPMSDAELMKDLDTIETEVARRKKTYPLEPFAMWAMAARHMAFARFDQRVKGHNAEVTGEPTTDATTGENE